MGQVPDDFLILLTILDTGYYKWSGYYQTFLLEKVAARQLALTERLVLILDLGREEGRRCHRLLDAFHFIWLVAYKTCSD